MTARWRIGVLAAATALTGCGSAVTTRGPGVAPSAAAAGPSADALYFPKTVPAVTVTDAAQACRVWSSDLASTFTRAAAIDDAAPVIRASSGLAPNIDGDDTSHANAPWFILTDWATLHPADPVAMAWTYLAAHWAAGATLDVTAARPAIAGLNTVCQETTEATVSEATVATTTTLAPLAPPGTCTSVDAPAEIAAGYRCPGYGG